MAMTALQLISSGGFYGAERVLVELAVYLRARGWSSHIGIFANRNETGRDVLEIAWEHGLPTVEFPSQRKFDLGTARRIRKYCQKHHIDIVHSHGYKPDMHLVLSRLTGITHKVATCHNWLSHTLKLRLYEWLDKKVLRSFDHVAAVSPQLLEKLVRSGVESTQISVIRNGIAALDSNGGLEVAAEQLRREFGLSVESRMIVFIGRLAPEKRLDLLLDALAVDCLKDIDFKLMLVGDGELRLPLELKARKLGIEDRVVFTGYRKDVPKLLKAADLFVLCSDDEGLPIVMLEAMSAKVPIISTAVGAIPEVIEDGVHGRLIPPNDAPALAIAIRDVFEDLDATGEMVNAAHRKFEDDHSQEAMGQQYLDLYMKLLEASQLSA
jgi:glycosyltransferase involved in cell wall biosynthesis